jgi:hypothetical protein
MTIGGGLGAELVSNDQAAEGQVGYAWTVGNMCKKSGRRCDQFINHNGAWETLYSGADEKYCPIVDLAAYGCGNAPGDGTGYSGGLSSGSGSVLGGLLPVGLTNILPKIGDFNSKFFKIALLILGAVILFLFLKNKK